MRMKMLFNFQGFSVTSIPGLFAFLMRDDGIEKVPGTLESS